VDPVVLTGRRYVGRPAVVAGVAECDSGAAHQADDALFAKLGRVVCCRGGRNH
jgi:hypothetical protein